MSCVKEPVLLSVIIVLPVNLLNFLLQVVIFSFLGPKSPTNEHQKEKLQIDFMLEGACHMRWAHGFDSHRYGKTISISSACDTRSDHELVVAYKLKKKVVAYGIS